MRAIGPVAVIAGVLVVVLSLGDREGPIRGDMPDGHASAAANPGSGSARFRYAVASPSSRVPAAQAHPPARADQATAMPVPLAGERTVFPVLRAQSFDLQFRPDERDAANSRNTTGDGMRTWGGQREPRNDPRFRPIKPERRQPEQESRVSPTPAPGAVTPYGFGQPPLPYAAPGWRGY